MFYKVAESSNSIAVIDTNDGVVDIIDRATYNYCSSIVEIKPKSGCADVAKMFGVLNKFAVLKRGSLWLTSETNSTMYSILFNAMVGASKLLNGFTAPDKKVHYTIQVVPTGDGYILNFMSMFHAEKVYMVSNGCIWQFKFDNGRSKCRRIEVKSNGVVFCGVSCDGGDDIEYVFDIKLNLIRTLSAAFSGKSMLLVDYAKVLGKDFSDLWNILTDDDSYDDNVELSFSKFALDKIRDFLGLSNDFKLYIDSSHEEAGDYYFAIDAVSPNMEYLFLVSYSGVAKFDDLDDDVKFSGVEFKEDSDGYFESFSFYATSHGKTYAYNFDTDFCFVSRRAKK